MLLVSFIAAFFAVLSPARSLDAVERRGARCEIRLTNSTVRPGGSGELEILFSADEGFSIATRPPVEVRFGKLSPLRVTSITPVSMRSKSELIDTRKPVVAGFIVEKKCKGGKHTVEGTVTYTVCSDAEGWSTKVTEPFELTFSVSP